MTSGRPPGTEQIQWQRASTAGEDTASVEVAMLGDGLVAMRDSRSPQTLSLVFNRAEWTAFLAGVREGEFADLETTVRES